MCKNCDERAIHFHLDREYIGNARSVHLHMHLSGPADLQRRALAPPSGFRLTPLVTFCEPPDGSPSVRKVRASGTAPGSICVIGTATIADGVAPDKIYGKVYPGAPSDIPTTVPSGAAEGVIVNMGSGTPSYTCPTGCPSCNFVFDSTHGGEIGGAQHSTASYPKNTVAIWITSGSTVYGPFTQAFLGKTSTTSECGGTSESPAPPPPIALAGPQEYVCKNVPLAFGKGPADVRLFRVREESTSDELVWKSSPKESPFAEWKLWVARRGGQPYGTLVLQSVMGSRQEAPTMWRGDDWSFEKSNRLILNHPSELAGQISDIDVVPG